MLKSHIKNLVSFINLNTPVLGEVTVVVSNKRNKSFKTTFLVVDGNLQPILGIKSCQEMGFIARLLSVSNRGSMETESLFDGIGCLNDFIYDIDLIENPSLKIHPARRIPHSLREKVKEELDNLVSNNIIEPVSEPTPCVSPMVVVKQNDKIRICIDPSDLNKIYR